MFFVFFLCVFLYLLCSSGAYKRRPLEIRRSKSAGTAGTLIKAATTSYSPWALYKALYALFTKAHSCLHISTKPRSAAAPSERNITPLLPLLQERTHARVQYNEYSSGYRHDALCGGRTVFDPRPYSTAQCGHECCGNCGGRLHGFCGEADPDCDNPMNLDGMTEQLSLIHI